MTRTRFAVTVVVLIAIASPVAAQTTAPIEVFGGYSLLSAGPDDFPRQSPSHGFHASVTANLNHWFGIVGDLSMQFNTTSDLGPGFAGRVARTRVAEYLVGPRFTARSARVSVFGHLLVGRATGDAGQDFSGFSDSGLMLGGGGGVDVGVTRRLAVRAQFDRLGAFLDIGEVTSRFGIGVVVRLPF